MTNTYSHETTEELNIRRGVYLRGIADREWLLAIFKGQLELIERELNSRGELHGKV